MNITPMPDERLDQINEHLSLLQKKNGLTFGTDAYLLAAYLRPMHRARAADFGCGTGIISLLAQSRGKFAHVTAIEIQESFAELTSRNIAINNLSDRIAVLHADITTLRPSDVGGELDVIFSNPPYMRTDSGKRNGADEKYIARHEVCGTVADFCMAAGRLLKHGGLFYVVWRPDRLTDLFDAMRGSKIEPKRMTVVYADAKSRPSMVLVEGKLGGSGGLLVTKPLIMHPDASEKPLVYTDDLTYIYENGEFGKEYERA
jgi:tRNA1Val (adenine37-N6)-methyltransferase